MAFARRDMTPDQIEEFLSAPRHAIVGTNRRDGPPQLTPIWYLHENGRIYFSADADSAKCRNLRRDPRISLCIAGDSPDARAVMMYGTAELFAKGSANWIEDIEWRLVRRYYASDEEARSTYYTDDGGQEAVIVVVTPDKVIAEDYND